MIIKLIRGDTKKIKFQRKTKNKVVITEKPDKMYFTVKKSYYHKDVLFQKKLDEDIIYNEQDNYYYLTIESNDTDELDYDKYVFDIEIINNNEKKIIAIGELMLDKEVTFAKNEV